MLKLSDFDYHLPKELIAQYPLAKRDAARLLVLNRAQRTITHRYFSDIPDYLARGDLLLLNDTRVLPCRLKGRRNTQGKVEVLLCKRNDNFIFDALIKPSRLKPNETVIFNHGKLSAKIISKNKIKFSVRDINEIYRHGRMPLPPYIKREARDSDYLDYQTVYARHAGAIASPTAGLHFTKVLLEKIKLSGVNIAYLTLHLGTATFKPVKIDDITQHKMEPENFCIPRKTQNFIVQTRKKGGRIFAVGTTSVRALESCVLGNKHGKTDLFIYPKYKFKLTDCLITNFHLPRTTLFMLVCAFAKEKLIKQAYQEAIEKKYRFYSYGDAMLII